MRVSVLLLGAFIVVIHTINVTAEPRHHGLRGPHKTRAFFSSNAKPYFGKSRSGRAGAKRNRSLNSKGCLTVPSLYAVNPKRCPTNIPSTVNPKDSSSPRPNDEPRTEAPTDSPTNICGVNEEWAECGRGPCEQPSCPNFGKPRNCTANGVCLAGCTCRQGYYRNNNNQCVRPNECENNVCPAMNEEITQCVSPCRETCATMGRDLVCNSTVCNEGCDCRAGYFRNSTGSCVLPNNCDCPIDETLDECIFIRRPQSCEDLFKPYDLLLLFVELETCTPKCVCQRGFYRNSEGRCVRIEQCPKYNCTSSEVYNSCGGSFVNCEECGDDRCRIPRISIIEMCEPKCLCKLDQFCRNSTGVCISNEGPQACPKQNTRYSACGKRVSAQSCALRGVTLPNTDCVKGCECIPGYYRNSTLACVAPADCACPDSNAEMVECPYKCGGGTCADPVIRDNCIEIICNTLDRYGCQCKAGYVRRSLTDSTCIALVQCPTAAT